MGVAIFPQDLASVVVRAKSDCMFLVFDFECRDYFGSGFLDTSFSEASMRILDEQANKSLQATRDGRSSSAIAVHVMNPAWLSSVVSLLRL